MEYQLEKHEVVAFVADTGDQRLQVTGGLIWLTRSGDPRDYILKPHSRFVVNQSDSVILEAAGPASFSLVPLEPPAHARIIFHYRGAPNKKAAVGVHCFFFKSNKRGMFSSSW